jgi:hypothetical protein
MKITNLAYLLHMRRNDNKVPLCKTNKDVAVAKPLVGDNHAVALLKGQLYGVVRVIDVEEKQRLLSHIHAHLMTEEQTGKSVQISKNKDKGKIFFNFRK